MSHDGAPIRVHVQNQPSENPVFHATDEVWRRAADRHPELARRLDVSIGWTREDLDAAIGKAEILVTWVSVVKETREIYAASAPRLRMIFCTSAGIDRVIPFDWLPPGVQVPFEKWGPWRVFMVFGAAWLTACAIWVGFTRRRTLQILVGVLAANGLLVALLGVAQRMTRTNLIYWNVDFPGAMTFGPFVYKNHGAGYLLLPLAAVCGLAGWFYLRGLRRLEKSNPSGVLAFAATFIAVAIVTSYARGATLTMLGYLLSCIAGFVAHQLSLPKEHRKTTILVVMILVFGYFLDTGLQALRAGEAWERMKSGLTRQDVSWESREWASAATWEMVKDHPITGAGAGSFQYVFPVYQHQDPRLVKSPDGRPMFWQQAHNDLLQFPAELGAIGCVLILVMLGWWLVELVRSYFWLNAFSLCLTVGLLALFLYSWFDFPFQCPAILVTWCVMWPVVTLWTQFEEQRSG